MISRDLLRRRPGQGPRVQLPLLDRLMDDAPDTAHDAPLSSGEVENTLRLSVRRDLEALLNSRQRWRSWPAGYSELGTSLVGYGIPDFTSGAFNEPQQRERLCASIEWAIRTFEPRLTAVRVTLIERPDALDSTLRLRIDGILRTEPGPEPIAFDTFVDSATTEVQVKPNAGYTISTSDV
jgi:type VI secretion system protein ImpF